MKRLRAVLASSALLAAICGSALAHTPFMKPANFHPTGDMVSAQAGYSLNMFWPALGVASPHFRLIAPDGTPRAFARVAIDSFETMLDAPLSSPGTYRLSTGEVYGEVTNMIYARGEWRAVRPGERVRARARTTTMQTVMLAEAYVTRGEPTRGPLEVTLGRLAIRPVTHPNQVSAAEGFDVELLFDGAPFPNMPFVLYEPGQSENDVSRTFLTDANGRAHLTFTHPGVYVTAVRHRADAPAGASAAVYSYSTSLTFEARAAAPPTAP